MAPEARCRTAVPFLNSGSVPFVRCVYTEPLRSQSDNIDYVKLGALGQRLFLGSQCFLNGLGPQACSRALVGI